MGWDEEEDGPWSPPESLGDSEAAAAPLSAPNAEGEKELSEEEMAEKMLELDTEGGSVARSSQLDRPTTQQLYNVNGNE